MKLSRDFALVSGRRVWLETNDLGRAQALQRELAAEGIETEVVGGRRDFPMPNRAYECLERP